MTMVWKIIITAVASIAIVGGSTYYVMERQISTIKSGNDVKISDLNNQLSDITKELATAKKKAATATATPAATTTTPAVTPTTGTSTSTVALATDSNGIKIGTVTINTADVANIQAGVDAGSQPWRLDPLQVAQAECGDYGFTQTDANGFTIISQAASAGTAEISAKHNSKSYEIDVEKPTPGDGKIYVTSAIKAL
jgi:hypothetical protein